jgi:hypothetical protein
MLVKRPTLCRNVSVASTLWKSESSEKFAVAASKLSDRRVGYPTR